MQDQSLTDTHDADTETKEVRLSGMAPADVEERMLHLMKHNPAIAPILAQRLNEYQSINEPQDAKSEAELRLRRASFSKQMHPQLNRKQRRKIEAKGRKTPLLFGSDTHD